MMHRIKHIQEKLLDCACEQVEDLSSVDAKELGEVIDMIKDLSETIYYHTVTEAMEKGDGEKWEHNKIKGA